MSKQKVKVDTAELTPVEKQILYNQQTILSGMLLLLPKDGDLMEKLLIKEFLNFAETAVHDSTRLMGEDDDETEES